MRRACRKAVSHTLPTVRFSALTARRNRDANSNVRRCFNNYIGSRTERPKRTLAATLLNPYLLTRNINRDRIIARKLTDKRRDIQTPGRCYTLYAMDAASVIIGDPGKAIDWVCNVLVCFVSEQ